jgi:hypothetical protein
MKKLILVCLVAAFFAVGCSTKVTTRGATAQLEAGQKILIAVPADGAYNGQVYAGSGQEAAERLRGALAPKASAVALSSSAPGNVAAALKEGRAGGYRYLIHPELAHWEHRIAAWSGIPTRVSLLMTVYDLKAGGTEPVVRQNLDARGRIMTFRSQFPADMAESLFRQFAAETF